MVTLLGLLGCLGGTLIPAFRQIPQLAFPAVSADTRDLASDAGSNAGPTAGDSAGASGSETPQPLLKRLPRKDRARVLAALAGLIILGFALVLLAWWGARFTRRYLRRPWPGSERREAGRVSEFDWASKPMYPDQDRDERAEGDPRD